MLIQPNVRPLRYDPADEELEAGEAETIQALCKTFDKIQSKTLEDEGRPIRAVHAKSWGLVDGELTVDPDLLPEYSQGIFSQSGKSYRVVLRFSAIPGDILPDEITAPRGLSIKIFGVEGDRLSGSEGDTTQDFVMTNGKHFQDPSLKVFLANLTPLAATTDKVEGLKKVMAATNRVVEAGLEAVGIESAHIKGFGGQPMTHPLGESFYSGGAIRWGDFVAKVSVTPASQNLKALTDQKVDVRGKPDGFREAVAEELRRNGGEWNVSVQLRNSSDMPIEDASKDWPEDDAPYLPVGRITVKPQTGWSEERAHVVDDAMFFSVWHGIEAHRPLGRIMRGRKETYRHAQEFRSQHNGCPFMEPRDFSGLPG